MPEYLFYHQRQLNIRLAEEAERAAWQANINGDTVSAEHHLLIAEGHYAFAEDARKCGPRRSRTAQAARPAVKPPELTGKVLAFPVRVPLQAAPVPAPARSPLHNLLVKESEGSGIQLLDPNKHFIDQL